MAGRTPSRFWALLAAGLGLMVAGIVTSFGARGGPPVAVATPSHRRVVAKRGEKAVVVSYQVQNRGRSDLILGEPSTTCNCTGVSIAPKRLKPGQSAQVSATGRPPGSGGTEVLIRIPTNAAEPELTLRLTLVGPSSPPYLAYESTAVRFGVIRTSTAEDRFFVETRERQDQPPWLSIPESTVPDLTVQGGLTVERDMGGGVLFRRYDYTARLTRRPEPGELTGEILIMARDSGDEPIHRIPVHGIARAPVYAVPPSLFASLAPGEAPPPIEVAIVADDPDLRLDAGPDERETDHWIIRETDRQDGRVHFEVTIRGPLSDSLSTMLVFKTDHPDAPSVAVPLMVHRSTARRSSHHSGATVHP
jgi:hypothetical protein